MARRRGKPARRAPQTQRTANVPAQAVVQDNEQEAWSRAVKALDAYTNTIAYLGGASELKNANGYERAPITKDYETLTVLYRENWLAKRIIDTPCEDMTRAWYSISSGLDQDKLDELKRLEAKHNIKQEITNGFRWARLYGGAAAMIVIDGQEDQLDRPMDFDDLMPGCFRGLLIVDRSEGIFPSYELEDEINDPDFGEPKFYDVVVDRSTGETVRVHHSRLIIFKGRMLPPREEDNEEHWGASELEHIYEELQKRDSTSANIAQLIFQANITALKISDYAEAMAMGTDKQRARIMNYIFEMNRLKNSFGVCLMGNEDNYEQHPYSFSGLSEIYESFMLDMAGAAEIPATKLFGRSPQGMNATGESDMKNYYEMLAQLQERSLRPAIDKLMPIMCMSLWGEIPKDIDFVFEPLMVTTPTERADIMQKITSVVLQAYNGGLVTQRKALEELQKFGKESGVWQTIDDELLSMAETGFENGEEEEDPMGMMGGMPGMPGGAPEGMPEGSESPEKPEPPKGGPENPPKVPEEPKNGPQEPLKPKDGEEPIRKPEAPQEAKKQPEMKPEKQEQEEPMQKQEPEQQKAEPKRQEDQDELSEIKARILEAAQNGEFDKARAAIAELRELKNPKAKDEKPRKRGLFRTIADRIHRRKTSLDINPETDYNKNGTVQTDFNPYHDKEGKFASKGGASGGGGAHWAANGESVKVAGPTKSKEYAMSYIEKHPHVAKMAEKLKHVRGMVQNFAKDHPDAEEGTYSATTGKPVEDLKGYCVTFHQNLAEDDPFGGYSDDDYAEMCAVAMDELGCDDVNIGYFGNPEVSFTCTDPQKAMDFAIRHNQHSIFDTNTFKTMKNPYYRKTLNPIEGH